MKTIIRKIESRESLTDDDIVKVLDVLEMADIVPESMREAHIAAMTGDINRGQLLLVSANDANRQLREENRLLLERLDAEIAHSQRLIREGTEDHVNVQRVLDALSYLGKDSDEDVIARVRKAVEK